MHVDHACIEFLIQELTRVLLMDNILLLKLKCSSSVSVVNVVSLRIVFSKAALQKRSSMEPMEPPLDPLLKWV